MKTQPLFLTLLFISLAGCSVSQNKSQNQTVTLVKAWETDTILKVPESVLYNREQDILYVSNINGKSAEKDGNGFISKLKPNGQVEVLQWASGLDAPKGMALYRDRLYVADVSNVVIIDINSGKIINTIEVPGAKFLNDATVDAQGNVFISDSETQKIHILTDGKISDYFTGPGLQRPNGLLAEGNNLMVLDAGTGTHYVLNQNKELTKTSQTAPGADGIEKWGNKGHITSNWNGEIYHIDNSGTAHKLLDTKAQKINAADIGLDAKNNLLFVPTFLKNSVAAYKVQN